VHSDEKNVSEKLRKEKWDTSGPQAQGERFDVQMTSQLSQHCSRLYNQLSSQLFSQLGKL